MRPQRVRLALQVLEVVGLGDLGHARRGPPGVDLDAQLADLLLERLLAGGHLVRHAPEHTRQLAEGVVACCDGVEALGSEGRVLDSPRRLDDIANLLDVLELEIVQALLGQAAVDPCAEQDGVEWLGQVVRRPHLDAAHYAPDVLERRDHDHGNVTELLVALDLREGVVAVELRHEDVEQDDVERLGSKRLQCPDAVLGRGDTVTLSLEVAGQEHPVHRVVVDDENGCRSRAHARSCPAACSASATRAYSSSMRATSSATSTRTPTLAIASTS